MSRVVEYVEVITSDGEFKNVHKRRLKFSYRHSHVQKTGDLVIELDSVCFRKGVQEIDQKVAELTHLRETNNRKYLILL